MIELKPVAGFPFVSEASIEAAVPVSVLARAIPRLSFFRSFLLGVIGLIGLATSANSLAQSPGAPPLRVGQTFITGALDPAQGSAGWALTSHGVGETLFTINREGRVTPQLASDIQAQADGSWIVTLRSDARFADGGALSAQIAAAALTRTNDYNAAARASVGKMQFEVLDAHRLRIRSERATPVMASVLAEWAFVIYKTGDAGPVFTGPYRIDAFRSGDGLDLSPNPFYQDAARRRPIVLKRFPDAQTMALALESGELDLAFNLPAESLPRLKSRGVVVKSFPVAYQYMMVLNTRREALSDVRVRRAIDLAIDRRELTLAVSGEPATGAFARLFPFALSDARPYSPAQAAQLLDEAGWKREADGKRHKDGKPLELTLTAYPQRADLVTFQPVLRARLAALGIGIQTRVVEQAGAVASARDFDLLLWAQHTAPAGDPAFFLNAFFRGQSGNNYAGISSEKIDGLLDRFATTGDATARGAIANEVQRETFSQASVVYLTTPTWHVGLSPRLASYEPWGSDYHIIRADLRAP